MYNENEPTIDWKGIILKVVFAAIVIILIVYLLPIKKKDVKVVKSDLFKSNLETLRSAADDYFILDKLPKGENETYKIYLKELVSDGITTKLRDLNGDACNENESYISATKKGSKYEVQIHLICDDEEETSYLYLNREVEVEVPTTTKIVEEPTTKRSTTKPIATTVCTTVVPTSRKVVKSTTTANKALVIFNTNGGSNVNSLYITRGNPIYRPVNPVKTGYIFKGWYLGNNLYNFGTPVLNNIIIEALWEPLALSVPSNPQPITKYTVTFNTNGGSYISPISVNSGEYINKPSDPYRYNHKFLGWYYNNKPYNFDERIYRNITLTAKWGTVKTYTEEIYDIGVSNYTGNVSFNNILKVPKNLDKTNIQNVRLTSVNYIRNLSSNNDLNYYYNNGSFSLIVDFSSLLSVNFAYLSNVSLYKTYYNLDDYSVTWTGRSSGNCQQRIYNYQINNACLYGILYRATWQYEVVI